MEKKFTKVECELINRFNIHTPFSILNIIKTSNNISYIVCHKDKPKDTILVKEKRFIFSCIKSFKTDDELKWWEHVSHELKLVWLRKYNLDIRI